MTAKPCADLSKKGAKEPIHTVCAFAARQPLALAQVKVSKESNEIAAIPALPGRMENEGAVITIDAMGCPRTIAQKVRDKTADYEAGARTGAAIPALADFKRP